MIEIDVDLGDIPRKFGLIGRQAEFALSTSINKTLLRAQNVQQRYFTRRFNVRSKSLPRAAFRMFRFSNTSTLTGTIGINRNIPWMEMHEHGGVFAPRRARNWAVPMAGVIGRRGRVPRSKRPRNLDRSFRINSNGRRFVFYRTGRGRRSMIRPAFALNAKIRLRPRLNFVQNVERTIQKHWRTEAEAAALDQLRRARLL